MFSFYNKVGHLRHRARRSSSSTRRSGCRSRSSCCATSSSGSRRTSWSRRGSTAPPSCTIFVRLILPLGLPAIASLAIFQFLWTWNDLIVALTFGQNVQPITVAIFSQPAPVRRQHRPDRARLVHLAGRAARGVLRLPALLRPGAARRLGEVSGGAECAIVGGGLAGFVAYATLHPRRDRAGGDRRLRATGADPAAAWRRRAAAIRQRRMRSESDGHCLPTSFPGLAVRAACAHAQPLAARRRASATATTRRSTSSSSTSRSCASRIGWDAAVVRRRVERIRAVDGGFDARRPRHVPRTCSSRPGHPGLNVPEELAGDPRDGPRLRAARVRRRRRRRRRRDGRGDRVAQRARRRCAGRRRCAAASRVRRPLNVPRPLLSRRGLAAFHATAPVERAAAPARRCSRRRTRRAGSGTSRSSARRRAVPRRGGGERSGADHLRDRLPPRLPARSRCSRELVDEHGLETARRLDRARARLHRARAHERRAHARARRASPAQWAYPGRRHARRARSTRRTASSGGCSDVVHAERPDRLAAARGARAARSSPACSRSTLHRWWPVEIGGADGRRRRRPRRGALRPAASPTSRAGSRCRSGALELALVIVARGSARDHGAARPARSRSSPRRGCSRRCSGTRCFPWLRLSYARGRRRARTRRAPPRAPRSARSCWPRAASAFATRPPTVTLPRGSKGPLVITGEETLVGEPGAVVRGGIVVRASGVDDQERHRRRRRERDRRRAGAARHARRRPRRSARGWTGSTSASRRS